MAGEKKDKELWDKVKKTIKPLSKEAGERLIKEALDGPTRQEQGGMSLPPRKVSKIIRPHVVEPPISITLAPKPNPIEQKTVRKIAKGKIVIDGKVDLHGFTQDAAQAKLLQVLQNAYMDGKRTILVVTGKGVRGEGILRQAVPRWLEEPQFRSLVSSFNEAHASHGGGGALYVRLRNVNKVR